jgi:hypothetical protein
MVGREMGEMSKCEVDEIYQEEELPTSFVVEPGAALDSLVGDGVDVTVLQK